MTFIECRPTIEKLIHKSLLVRISSSFTSLEFVSPGSRAHCFHVLKAGGNLHCRILSALTLSTQLFSSSSQNSLNSLQPLWSVFLQLGTLGHRAAHSLCQGSWAAWAALGVFNVKVREQRRLPRLWAVGAHRCPSAQGFCALCITSGWANVTALLQGSSGE